MSVGPADFYELARRSRAAATTEIDHRNAISRLYYAAFHHCVLRLGTTGEVPSKIGHLQFCEHLLKHPPSSPRRNLGVALNHLRQQRNAADYTLNRDFASVDVTTAFGAYDNVMRFLKALPEASSAN